MGELDWQCEKPAAYLAAANDGDPEVPGESCLIRPTVDSQRWNRQPSHWNMHSRAAENRISIFRALALLAEASHSPFPLPIITS